MEDKGVDPGNGGVGEPGKCEEGEGKKRTADHGSVETVFGSKRSDSVGGFQMKKLGGVDIFIGDNQEDRTEDAASGEAEEGETLGADVEMMNCGEDIGVCGDEEGDETKCEGIVEAEEANDRLCE